MITEKEKLYSAVDEFSVAMKRRLVQKQKQGYRGWDNKDINSYSIPTRLFYKSSEIYAITTVLTEKNLRKKMLVDIANFAMMLWKKCEK
jgi:hypothetical protein